MDYRKQVFPVVAGMDIDGSCEYAYTHNNHSRFIKKALMKLPEKKYVHCFGVQM